MLRVDYERVQYRQYAATRALTAEALDGWLDAFERRSPEQRPLAVLDLGSGTGRFTPGLARRFGGPVFGVEPAEAMLRQAPAADGITYLQGNAEQIPLRDASVDLVLMFLSFHHVTDRAAAGREVARVLRPGGRLLVRTALGDQLPDLLWHRFFPGAKAVEARVFPTYDELVASFGTLTPVAHDHVPDPYAPSFQAYSQRLKRHAISTFEHLSAEEIAHGDALVDAAVDAAVARGDHAGPVIETADLVTFARP
ncbi:MAG TPA: class I SAM-dependent methyltransferase [Streptosporangiaceae bacterium]|nr:class I SAM-dependent methyltransferase [Streptosporangiaceae bacterium]